MKNLLKLIIIVAIFATAYHFRFELNQKLSPYLRPIQEKLGLPTQSNPCVEPTEYTLGNFDTKFGISKEYFLSALSDAEAIWEKPYNKELFTYRADSSTSNALKVNLIYDYRQQATSKLEGLGIVVNNNRASYEMLKAKFDALKLEYERNKNDFNARVEAFNRKQLAYEQEVSYWNKRGGAPKEEYDKLQRTHAELQAESRQIKNSQDNLNAQAEEINALVVVLNRLISSLNLSVEKFNTTNEARGETFEEGLYISDGENEQIDIYEFSSREKLVRVLAHELGHALGLDHVDDPKAIMYALNQGNSQALTKADLDALKAKCGM